MNWTTTLSAENISSSDNGLWLKGILAWIRMAFLPIVVAGTVTNIINFYVLTRPEMKSTSTTVYLLALAGADLALMYVELFRIWFEWTEYMDKNNFHDPYCQIINFCNGVVRDFANWLIACVTLERVVMVARPYLAPRLCTRKRAHTVTLVLFACLCMLHMYSFYYSSAKEDMNGHVCWEDRKKYGAVAVTAIVQFIGGYMVVFVVLGLNCVLICIVCERRKSPISRTSKTNPFNRRLTRTLVVVATVFVVCETPHVTMVFVGRFIKRNATSRILLNISFLISGINHACNFFIYVLSSPRFRNLLLTAPLCRRLKMSKTGPVVCSDVIQPRAAEEVALVRRPLGNSVLVVSEEAVSGEHIRCGPISIVAQAVPTGVDNEGVDAHMGETLTP